MDTPGLGVELQAFLRATAPEKLADLIAALADTSRSVAAHIRRGAIAGPLGASVGVNSDGDTQKALDLFADHAFEQGLRECSVRALASEERDAITPMRADGAYLVAIDPLDGSSNIDVNITLGTIFSVLAPPETAAVSEADFLQPGHAQQAAGLVLYGPHTSLVFTTGAGTHVATLDPTTSRFYITNHHVSAPDGRNEFAINMSNMRHWPAPVKAYVDDLLMGSEGPRARDFNMRWIASMAADVYRVLLRGGVYLYPDDARPGYGRGRLHLLYEANPVALLIEQAGGLAIDGVNRILDLEVNGLHARTPLIFGATDKVETVREYFLDGHRSAARAPLFGRRGLWRA
ncbi:MAG: class 1 fructose-bisphosphatase [Pseudomonadota bacterium]|nr:class 1 fructose-bisphosphatase [Pseudomonadota bacterium]